jgi:hypothetical protein
VATTDAIFAVCEAITRILEGAAAVEAENLGLDGLGLSFKAYHAGDFSDSDSPRHVTSGASIFLYRVLPNLAHRTPAGRLQPNGQRRRTRLPIDLHLLVTVWGSTPDTQNRLLGWVMRTLEDYPTLPASLLNLSRADIFEPNETVELVLGEMPNEELLHLWEVLGNGETHYQPSLPYVARAVMLDSLHTMPAGEPIQVRTLDMQRLKD